MTDISPEQEQLKQQCVFCHIISGKIPSRKIYEDETCLAILDINPANPGHTLIIPKKHHPIMPMMPEEEIEHMFRVAKKISAAIIRGLKTDGTNIFIANGSAAGQKAPHFMIHVIPRRENDGITCFKLPKNQIGEEDQAKLKKAIKEKMANHLGPGAAGAPEEEPPAEEEHHEEEKPEENPDPAEDEEAELIDIPPPEHFAGNSEDEEEEEQPKKGPDLDRISKLFG